MSRNLPEGEGLGVSTWHALTAALDAVERELAEYDNLPEDVIVSVPAELEAARTLLRHMIGDERRKAYAAVIRAQVRKSNPAASSALLQREAGRQALARFPREQD